MDLGETLDRFNILEQESPGFAFKMYFICFRGVILWLLIHDAVGLERYRQKGHLQWTFEWSRL